MYGGEIVECGSDRRRCSPTRGTPTPGPCCAVATIGDWPRRTLEIIPGQPPAAGERMPGCRFAPRCRYAAEACLAGPVPLTEIGPGRSARCVRLDELVTDASRDAPDRIEASA